MPDPAGSSVNIVGGGIAGLIAAVHLGRAGASVSVFESAGAFGGRARTREADGFFLNQGPHALYRRGAFRRELDRLGIGYAGGLANPPRPLGLWRGRMHTLPGNVRSLITTGLLGVADKLGYVRVLKAIMNGATGAGTFAQWMDGQRLSPRLRASLEALARVTSYTHAPEIVSAAAMLDQMRLGLKGVLYLDCGWSVLVGRLMDAARDAGVRLYDGARVEIVRQDGSRWRIELADGSAHASDAVVLAVGPQVAAALAPGMASLAQEAREAKAVRANTLDLALSGWPKGGREFVLGIDRPYYLSLHSEAAKLAPAGGAVVHLARYLAPDEMPGRDAISELEELADQAIPGWRALEIRRQELRGMTVSNAIVRADRPRPDVAVDNAPGLFIAGDWVGTEGMIADCAAASAAKAAEAAKQWLTRDVAKAA